MSFDAWWLKLRFGRRICFSGDDKANKLHRLVTSKILNSTNGLAGSRKMYERFPAYFNDRSTDKYILPTVWPSIKRYSVDKQLEEWCAKGFKLVKEIPRMINPSQKCPRRFSVIRKPTNIYNGAKFCNPPKATQLLRVTESLQISLQNAERPNSNLGDTERKTYRAEFLQRNSNSSIDFDEWHLWQVVSWTLSLNPNKSLICLTD